MNYIVNNFDILKNNPQHAEENIIRVVDKSHQLERRFNAFCPKGDGVYYASLDRAVRVWRAEHNVTQAQLAEMMGMAPNTLMFKQRGEHDFTLPEAIKLANLIGFSIDDVARLEDGNIENSNKKAVGK